MSRMQKFLTSVILLGLVGLVASTTTYAAFSDTTANGGNVFAAGTVTITDNDAGGALLSLSNAKPGDSATGCIKITFSGSLDSTVRLYASTTGSLAQYLTLTVTRGDETTPSFPSCTTFTADSPNYIGAGPGIIYSGTLGAFPASYGAGIVDPTSGSPRTWVTGEAHSYMFVLTLQNNPAAQALSSTATFTWEARNQ